MILNFRKVFTPKSYLSISILGRSFKLDIQYSNINIVELNKTENEIIIALPKKYKNSDNMDIINLSIQKLYNEIAMEEIEYAMEFARHTLGFAPEDYKIKRLNDSYYKCANKIITINPDIVQFSREIIYTTVLRAFCKVKYRTNSRNYKDALEFGLKKYNHYKNKNYNKNLWLKVS